MKIQMQKWKIHISVDFPQLTLGRWQVSAELMDAPSGSNRKAHNPDLAIADTAGIYLYHQGNEKTTGGTVEAAAKPWLIPAGK